MATRAVDFKVPRRSRFDSGTEALCLRGKARSTSGRSKRRPDQAPVEAQLPGCVGKMPEFDPTVSVCEVLRASVERAINRKQGLIGLRSDAIHGAVSTLKADVSFR